MVNFCAVVGCSHRSDRENCKFHRLPCVSEKTWSKNKAKIKARQKAWLRALKCKDIKSQKLHLHRVCACHFINGHPATLSSRDDIDWIPTLNMGYKNSATSHSVAKSEREERCHRREKSKDIAISLATEIIPETSRCAEQDVASQTCTSSSTELSQTGTFYIDDVASQTGTFSCIEQDVLSQTGTSCTELDLALQTGTSSCTEQDVASQTQLTSAMIEQLEQSHQDYVSENASLRKEISGCSGNGYPELEALRHDSKLVILYTGLPSCQVLEVLFNFLMPVIIVTASSKLSQFQQFIMVLMKLRLNLPYFDLAFRFKVSESTVSRLFNKLILAFEKRLFPIIRWPSRKEISQTMPFCFQQAYGQKVIGIIDCFEIFTEKSSDLFAKAATYSQYKSYNTAKYLICITPQGTVSYVSDGYGGRVSDKFITEHCGFLDRLLPGDVVLADRGFNIEDLVAYRGATLQIPAFTHGKQQLSPLEVETTRSKANLRIHVERVIGAMRQSYPIVCATACTPWEYVQPRDGHVLLDAIVKVCCVLHNLHEGIVPFE